MVFDGRMNPCVVKLQWALLLIGLGPLWNGIIWLDFLLFYNGSGDGHGQARKYLPLGTSRPLQKK